MIPCFLFETKKSDKCYSCKTCTEKYLYFDFEAMQETGIHIPNLVVVHDFEGKEKIFYNNEEFCKWLISKEHKNYTAKAHNAKGYDSQFILKYCVENTLKPFTVYNGTKLMLLEIECLKLKIIDSMNFVAQPLSTFPKTFGLSELKKGYFPHYFNKKCNQSYVGKLPAKKHYGYDQMKREQRQQFLEWYNKKVEENYVFDFQKELIEYCRSDVDILRRGCLKLREEFLEIANIDPFQYLTIASVCMAIYRSKYLKENTIAVVDKEQKDTYSKESICWLDFIMSKDNINIRHALNGGEKHILGYKVDGYCEETNTVYQFHGCFWHGCPKCFNSETINNKNQKTMKDLYNQTLKISNEIMKEYKLIEIWECDFKKDKEIKKFEKTWNREVITPLNPRDAFYGGRTNAIKLLYTCRKSHKIRYIDVCSLYPTVQFYDYYPVGHPIKILEPNYYDRNWYGFIKCKILPPRALYHPVLPTKIHMGKSEKLLFPLCLTCAKNKIQKCNHSDNERVIIGTWTTDEVNLAIEKGYKIDKVYEVWHFKEKSNELFRGYVKDFMKIKLETSSWKNDFNTIEEYINTVKEKLDITLEKDKIQENPGKRAVAKTSLNSLWGKFGQRQNMSKTEYVTDIKRFYEIILDDRLDNINLTFLNETMVQMSYCFKDQYVENDHNTNVFIAAFTTSNARLRLYKMLDYLGDKVAYYDTDGIFYIDDGTKTVETGCLLGDWTDELKGKHIINWVSTGPKSYAYIDNDLKEVCKIKGFYLNYENSQFINFKIMNKMVKKECKGVTIVEENKITRDPKTKNIVNKYQEKFFSFDYDKRIINKINDEHIDTLPYGY
jgi:ribosomal protein S20